MEDSKILKRQPHLILILPVIIIIISALFYVVFFNEASGITALEERAVADNLAKEWNESAELVNVMGMGEIYSGGRCEKWGYSYTSNNPDINLSKGFAVTICANGTIYSGELRPPSPSIINNWLIDSDEAMEIAKSNPEIKQFLNKYHSEHVERIVVVPTFRTLDGYFLIFSHQSLRFKIVPA